MDNFVFSNDKYVDAYKKCILGEAALPMHNGQNMNSDSDTYNKVQTLLNCPEMIQSHKFLYNIDFDILDEDTIRKVDELYNLAKQKNLITEEDKSEQDEVEDDEKSEDKTSEKAETLPVTDKTISSGYQNADQCFTCFYSAIKDEEIKTGECYTNAKNPQAAKIDAISKLTKIGFTNINILAIETNDSDLANDLNVIGSEDTIPHMNYDDNENKEPEKEKLDENSVEIEEATEVCPKCHQRTLVGDPHSGNMRCTNCHYWQKTGGLDTKDYPYKYKPYKMESITEADAENTEDAPENKKENNSTELSKQEKIELFTKYYKIFKDVLIKMKKTSYSKLTIQEKIDFLTDIKELWGDKVDPKEFMTPANKEKLENMEINTTK